MEALWAGASLSSRRGRQRGGSPPSRLKSAIERVPSRFRRWPRQRVPRRRKIVDTRSNCHRAARAGSAIAGHPSRNPRRSSNKSGKLSWWSRRAIGRRSPPPATRPEWPAPARKTADRTNCDAWTFTRKYLKHASRTTRSRAATLLNSYARASFSVGRKSATGS